MDIYGSALKLDIDDDRYGVAYKRDVIEAYNRCEYIRTRHPGFSQIRRIAVLWIAVGVLFLMIFRFLNLQFEADNHRGRIVDMQKSLSKLSYDNEDEYRRLTKTVDLDQIKDIAINDLGMVYAASDQIVSFDVFEYDYVKQTSIVE